MEAGIDPFSGFSTGSLKLLPDSHGFIHIRSRDPREPPRIDPRYFVELSDQETGVALLQLIRRIAARPEMWRLIIEETRPGPEVGDHALLEYARETGQTAWHTVGTCRMRRAGEGAVDGRLRVRGVDGLRVIDASVMPTIVSSNINAATIRIGERGADMVREDAR